MPKHSHLGFTKLLVNQLEPAADFYKSVCGLVEVARIEDELAGRKISDQRGLGNLYFTQLRR